MITMNLWSRVGNKVFLQVAEGKTQTFDELFDLVHGVEWSDYLKLWQDIIVNAMSHESMLHSEKTLQAMGKKAIMKKMIWEEYWQWDHDAQAFDVEIVIDHDQAGIYVNTTGPSLHQRGYRQKTGDAPLKESLAAGFVLMSGWKFHKPFLDPCCGSGTICIEAAMIAKNIAPGIHRNFAFQQFSHYDHKAFELQIEEARSAIYQDKTYQIVWTDIDPAMIVIAKENARHAGVSDCITFATQEVAFYIDKDLTGTLMTNPPYGMRLKSLELAHLYRQLLTIFEQNAEVNGGIFTWFEGFDRMANGKDWKKKPFYNGGQECIFWKRRVL